ncbi:DJ-1 family protein [Thalassoporum mexicanum PCC 7367]|uniref:DJ-1 family glyoxalase III n=1 Tax=Thalassoporum mexicanum TaxID=3457544 RepID=UPI00029F95E4|nr:DJ-1 family glyoxalase III [Pseudanabaena sp. PCC 7367]AFY70842.1 DJ-1 family protein [Pseudanabaena sp. PCC 7367]
MPKALVPLAEGVEEIEAITIVDVLRRGEIEVMTTGLDSIIVTGSHQITIMADQILQHIKAHDYDLLVLPGGPGTKTLREDPRIIEIVKDHVAAGKLTAAVCAAPTVLSAAGVLADKRATSFPGTEADMQVGEYVHEAVVVDGKIVTSRGPGTVMAFALKLVELVQGQAIADKLAESMVYAS